MALVGGASANEENVEKEGDMYRERDDEFGRGMQCGYTNPVGGAGFLFPAHHDICAADHPETKRLKSACEYTLDHYYPDVPTVVARGAIPYFDVLSVGGFSHWLFPEHINDYGTSLNPGRPETILMNNNTYCAQGVMFIPPHEQKGRESPVYVTGNPDQYDNQYAYVKRRRAYDDVSKYYTYGNADYRNSGPEGQGYWDEYEMKEFDVEAYEDEGTICAPWHYHTDGAARFAWWYNRQFHQGAALEDDEVQFWCHVPGMFHVWPGAPEEDVAVYEHDAPSDNRTGKTACRGGYPNPYTPDDGSELTLEDLPGWLQEKAMPADLERELRILGDYDDATLYQMTIGEIKDLVGFDATGNVVS